MWKKDCCEVSSWKPDRRRAFGRVERETEVKGDGW